MKKSMIIKINIAIVFLIAVLALAGCKKNKEKSEWEKMVKSNYDEFITEVSTKNNIIPLIVHTDQHGSISYDSEIYTYINSIVDWSKISKIINLGDTVKNTFNVDDLENYLHATSCLPSQKRIEQIGNHDRTTLTDISEVKQFFITSSAETSSIPFNFSVIDSDFNVKYIAVDYKKSPWGYESGYLDSIQADFIINELSKIDSNDVIILSHAYLFRDNLIDRYGNHFTGSDYFIGSSSLYADVKESYCNMLQARKNKTSGVLIDCEGNSHQYDFSNCTSNLLMTIHGHHHTEGYETYKNVTEFLFQSMVMDNKDNNEPNCFYFCYIDTINMKFKYWKNVSGYSSVEINI